MHFWVHHQKARQITKMISGWTETFSWGGWRGRKQPPTHPHPHILNNVCIVVRASAWFWFFFFSALSSKVIPHPADSAQTKGCCCLPSYKAQEGIFILANSDQFSLKGSTQHTLLTPWQPYQRSKCRCKQWGNENSSLKEHLDKGRH